MDLALFDDPDPDRAAKEGGLTAMAEDDLLAVYRRTRQAATAARAAGDMARLYALVRGTKTIQRLADARGLVITADGAMRRSTAPSSR